MPRTKAPNKTRKDNIFREAAITPLQNEFKKQLKTELLKLKAEIISNFQTYAKERTLKLMMEFGEMTVGEFEQNNNSKNHTTSHISASVQNILGEPNTNTRSTTRMGLKRSLSCLEDEGYLTAESSNGTTSGVRQSRAKQRQSKTTKRISRSASNIPRSASKTNSSVIGRSASNASKYNSVLGKFKTPNNNHRHPPNSYGIVTPKVAPNTPQVLLRRPKLGEVAFSLQGSPLFTGSVVSETIANINIPLEDGKLLSIQPQRGLRLSQIPKLDSETTRQLQMLRDNLNKMCAAGGFKR